MSVPEGLGYRAAWVPYAPDRDLRGAVSLAANWTKSSCSPGVTWTLLTSDFGVTADGVPGLADFAGQYRQITPKTRPAPGGPLLVYWPDLRMMCMAHRLARGNAVAVVEAGDFALSGWAAVAHAVDLLRPDAPSIGLDAQLAQSIADLGFYGNNAYSAGSGRERAKNILVGLRRDALLDRDLILSARLAQGASPTALKALEKLITSVERSP